MIIKCWNSKIKLMLTLCYLVWFCEESCLLTFSFSYSWYAAALEAYFCQNSKERKNVSDMMLRGGLGKQLKQIRKQSQNVGAAVSVKAESFVNGTNAAYVEDMYLSWMEDPKSVHASWNAYFKGPRGNNFYWFFLFYWFFRKKFFEKFRNFCKK